MDTGLAYESEVKVCEVRSGSSGLIRLDAKGLIDKWFILSRNYLV